MTLPAKLSAHDVNVPSRPGGVPLAAPSASSIEGDLPINDSWRSELGGDATVCSTITKAVFAQVVLIAGVGFAAYLELGQGYNRGIFEFLNLFVATIVGLAIGNNFAKLPIGAGARGPVVVLTSVLMMVSVVHVAWAAIHDVLGDRDWGWWPFLLVFLSCVVRLCWLSKEGVSAAFEYPWVTPAACLVVAGNYGWSLMRGGTPGFYFVVYRCVGMAYWLVCSYLCIRYQRAGRVGVERINSGVAGTLSSTPASRR